MTSKWHATHMPETELGDIMNLVGATRIGSAKTQIGVFMGWSSSNPNEIRYIGLSLGCV